MLARPLFAWIGCSPCTQEVEGSTPTGGICPNDFSDPVDQDIRTQWALSWKIVVSEWRSVIAVSLNVDGGVRLIKPAKLCICTQNTTNTTRTDALRRVCAAMVPYPWATRGTSEWELEYTHKVCEFENLTKGLHSAYKTCLGIIVPASLGKYCRLLGPIWSKFALFTIY